MLDFGLKISDFGIFDSYLCIPALTVIVTLEQQRSLLIYVGIVHAFQFDTTPLIPLSPKRKLGKTAISWGVVGLTYRLIAPQTARNFHPEGSPSFTHNDDGGDRAKVPGQEAHYSITISIYIGSLSTDLCHTLRTQFILDDW